MATVTSTQAAETVQPRTYHAGVNWAHGTYSVPETGDGTAEGDVIELVRVPNGARVLELVFTSEDLDSATSHVFDVGYGGDVDVFIDGTTIGQSGGVARLGAGVAAAANDLVFHKFTTEDTIDAKVITASGTKVAGVISLAVLYSLDD